MGGSNNEDEETRRREVERIKAEARAYALSDMTRKKERERAKFSNLPASMMSGTYRARRRPPPPPPPHYHPGLPLPGSPHHQHHINQHNLAHQPPSYHPVPCGYPPYHHPYPPYHPHYPPVHPRHSQHPHSVNETDTISFPISPPEKQDVSTQQSPQKDVVAAAAPLPSRPTFTPHSWNFDEYDEDYGRFVKSLWDDDLFVNDEEEDADEFHLDTMDDEDEDDDDKGGDENVDASERDGAKPDSLEKQKKGQSASLLDPDLFCLGNTDYQELEEELGWLEEEDMEAAVTTLLDPPDLPRTPLASSTSSGSKGNSDSGRSPPPSVSTQKTSPQSQSTPFRDAARATHVTETQYNRLQQLFHSHYQLLLQQTVLAARAAPTQSKTMESASDLTQIVNHATGMLQDIDQHRRTAILSKVQQGVPQRLTRLQFSKSMQEHDSLKTVFDVEGLKQLNETFDWIDKSVEVLKTITQGSFATLNQEENTVDEDKGSQEKTMDQTAENAIDRILPTDTESEACQKVFKHAGARFNADLLPATRDLSELFADLEEVLGEDFIAPCTPEQNALLRKNRNLFTFGEDNLVLQGVNLYGEKQWILLADRLLPDRSVNIISQRFAKLSVMLYRANGVKIDEEGNLETPPKFDNIDDADDKKARKLSRVQAPAVLNVHRWSLQEDVTTLKAVSIYGTMWAEISSKYLPHRDRGHIRKRYLVLQRRIKSAVSREKKSEPSQRSKPPANRLEPALPKSRTATHAPVVGAHVPQKMPMETIRAGPYAPSRPVYTDPRIDFRNATYRPHTPARDELARNSSFIMTRYQSPHVRLVGKPFASYQVGSIQEENSRAAFEKLVQDAGSRVAFERLVEDPDSSQGCFMKHSQESDTESIVATTIVTKLASAYPSGYLENNDSHSQFSMLDSYRLSMSLSRDAPRDSRSPRKSVVYAAIDQDNIPAAMPPPSNIIAQENSHRSPQKSKKLTIQETPPRVAANTPTTQSFCEFGALLSPALRNLASPSLTLHTFQETSNLIKEGGFTLDLQGSESQILSVPPTPSSAKSSPSSDSSHGTTQNHFWSQHSTLMANDLEAISALNSLSSSPALCYDTTSPSKSFFAKVVGRARNSAQPATKKRKLQF